MIESIVYFLARVVALFFRSIPRHAAYGIGHLIGQVGYFIPSRRKNTALNNLRIAFSRKKSPAEIQAILKKMFVHFALNVIDTLRLPCMAREGYEKLVDVKGKEHIDRCMKEGRGLICLTLHSGSWEVGNMTGSLFGYPYNLVANPIERQFSVAKLLNEYRTFGGAQLINPGLPIKHLIQKLKNNEMVTLVLDQGGHSGEMVNFMGRKASMSNGAIRLSLKYNIPICTAVLKRKADYRHELCIEPFELTVSGDRSKDQLINLGKAVRFFEEKIEENPQEYFWFYKIWKHSKERYVTILDDGRTGHLRQSQTAAQILVEEAKARHQYQVYTSTFAVVYKNRAWKKFLISVTYLSQFLPFLRQSVFLKWSLTHESYRSIYFNKADHVISCGAMAAPVNFLLSKSFDSKSMVILKPGALHYRYFDLVILPQHDRPPILFDNILITRLAPNLLTDEFISTQTKRLLNRFSHLKSGLKMRIGVLLGGNTKTIRFAEREARVVCHQLRDVMNQLNAEMLITTSRRTPPEVEQYFIRQMRKDSRCALLVVPNRQSVPEALGGIIGLSDIIVVSGESISMISEAVSSGKKVVVFQLRKSGVAARPNKYHRFVDLLNAQGYVIASDINSLSHAIFNLVKNKVTTRPVNDRAMLADAIGKIT